jgi:hypothetical protein
MGRKIKKFRVEVDQNTWINFNSLQSIAAMDTNPGEGCFTIRLSKGQFSPLIKKGMKCFIGAAETKQGSIEQIIKKNGYYLISGTLETSQGESI